jgi:hypothetical protein
MIRVMFLFTAFAGATLAASAVAAPPESNANAALKYWQAYATLPKLADAEAERLNINVPERELDSRDRQLVSEGDYALAMLHHGSALPDCDWGIGFEDGMFVRNPHVMASSSLAALARLRARIRFEEGQEARAVDDLIAAMTLGRHLSSAGVSHELIAGYNIEHRAIDTLARVLPRLKPSDLRVLKDRLNALPASGRPALAVRGEEQMLLDWFVRSVKEAKDHDALLALVTLVDQVCSLPDKAPDPAAQGRAFLDACGGNTAGVLARAEEARPLYQMLATTLDRPYEQFAVHWKSEEAKHARNPVVRAFLGRIVGIRFQQARVDVRRAYLSAALDVCLQGRDALKQHKDPVVGGPINYVPFRGGFELRSKLKWDASSPSVTLLVGERMTGPADARRSPAGGRTGSSRKSE